MRSAQYSVILWLHDVTFVASASTTLRCRLLAVSQPVSWIVRAVAGRNFIFFGQTVDEHVEFSTKVGKNQTEFTRNDIEQVASTLHTRCGKISASKTSLKIFALNLYDVNLTPLSQTWRTS